MYKNMGQITLLKIKQEGDKGIRINDDDLYLRTFSGHVQGGYVLLYPESARNGDTYAGKIGELQVGDSVPTTAEEAMAALEFIGNFKGGDQKPILASLAALQEEVSEDNGAIKEMLAGVNDKLDTLLAEVEATGGMFVPSRDWEEAALPPELATGTLYSYLFKGEVYVSTSTYSSQGIFRLNKAKKSFDKVYNYGYAWANWFEAGGRLFVCATGSNTGAGILRLNEETGLFEAAYDAGANWSGRLTVGEREYWFPLNGMTSVYGSGNTGGLLLFDEGAGTFEAITTTGYASGAGNFKTVETSKGVFMYLDGTSLVGIYRLNEETGILQQVYATGYYWRNWIDSGGELFVSSDTSFYGILRFDADTGMFVLVYAAGYAWRNWVEFDGELFVSSEASSSSLGILRFDADAKEFVVAHAAGYGWKSWKEFGGELFVSSENTVDPGILRFDPGTGTFVTAYATGIRWKNWKEFDGKLFVSSEASSSSLGILRYDPDTGMFVVAHATGYYWKNWKEFGDELFVSSDTSFYGILRFDADTGMFVLVYATGYNWKNWLEFDGQLFVSSTTSGSNSTGILRYDAGTGMFVVAYALGYNWTDWKEFAGQLFAFGYNSSSTGILRYDAGTGMLVVAHAAGYYWLKVEAGGTLHVSTTNSTVSGLLVLNTDTWAFQVEISGYYGWYECKVGDAIYLVSSYNNGYVLQFNPDTGRFANTSVSQNYGGMKEFDGYTLVWSGNTSYPGVTRLTETAVTKVLTTGVSLTSWIEGGEGSVAAYVSCSGSSSAGLYRVTLSNGSMSSISSNGYNWNVFYESDAYMLAQPTGTTAAAAMCFKKPDMSYATIGGSGYGARVVYEAEDFKVFSGVEGQTTFSGASVIKNDGTVMHYTSSGYAWRVFAEFNGAVYLSSKQSAGIFKAFGSSYSMTNIYNTGYNWGNPVEHDGDLYVSSTGFDDYASQGLLKLNDVENGFDKVYSRGASFRFIPMTGGDHWVSESYDHVYPLVSTGFQIDGYQSGPVMDGYTVNRHGIVMLTNEAVKEVFISKYEMPDELSCLEGDANDFYIYSRGSIIYNVNVAA
jgi:hypothetical protein